MKNNFNYFPYKPLFIITFILFLILLIALIQLGIITYAYGKLGINGQYVFLILMLSLLGSYINIPILKFHSENMTTMQQVNYFGMRYRIPVITDRSTSVLAVNVGGAVIPVLLSLYLLLKNGIYIDSLVAITIMSIIINRLSRPVPGLGIAVPVLIPPVAAAIIALMIKSESAPALAYISGTLGTLIGGDLMNIEKIKKMGAPVSSIGGAGTFDGIFVTGIIAVLLA